MARNMLAVPEKLFWSPRAIPSKKEWIERATTMTKGVAVPPKHPFLFGCGGLKRFFDSLVSSV